MAEHYSMQAEGLMNSFGSWVEGICESDSFGERKHVAAGLMIGKVAWGFLGRVLATDPLVTSAKLSVA